MEEFDPWNLVVDLVFFFFECPVCEKIKEVGRRKEYLKARKRN